MTTFRTKVQIQALIDSALGYELPLVPEFFEFAYSDEGANDPETILLEKEESGDMSIEIVTVNSLSTVYFNYHKD